MHLMLISPSIEESVEIHHHVLQAMNRFTIYSLPCELWIRQERIGLTFELELFLVLKQKLVESFEMFLFVTA